MHWKRVFTIYFRCYFIRNKEHFSFVYFIYSYIEGPCVAVFFIKIIPCCKSVSNCKYDNNVFLFVLIYHVLFIHLKVYIQALVFYN